MKNFMFKITGDLSYRKKRTLITGIKSREDCDELMDLFTRKGWTNLKISKE